MIHTVHIVPALGHSSSAGAYERGHSIGRLSQLDVIDGYYPTVLDELEASRIRTEVMPTRRPPGVRHDQRHVEVALGSCVVELRCGWLGRTTKGGNCSRVLYGKGTPFALAESLQDAVAEWGRCYVYGHRGQAPVEVDDPLLTRPGTVGFAVEPFALDGPDAGLYAVRLATLGRTIGRIIASFARERGWTTHLGGVRGITTMR